MTKRPPPRTSFRTLPTPPENPVQQAELVHLQRSPLRRSGRTLLLLTLLPFLVSVALSVGLYLMGRSGGMTSVDLTDRYRDVQSILGVVNSILLLLVLALNVLLIWELLLVASDSIAREKRLKTWETLALTPLSAWQIVTGKWRGVQAYIYRQYGWTMLLRAGIFVWLALTAGAGTPFATQPETLRPDALRLLAALVLIGLYLALNLALAGASGLLASFLPTMLPPVGGALIGQFGIGISITAVNLGLLRLMESLALASPPALGMSASFAGVAFDGATLAALQLLYTPWPDAPPTLLALAGASGLLYTLLIFGGLVLARWFAMRQGAAA